MSSTNVPTTGATVLAVVPYGCSALQAYNGGANPVQLQAGPTGAKVIPLTLAAGQQSPVMDLSEQVGAADVLKAFALGSNNTTGYLILNFFG